MKITSEIHSETQHVTYSCAETGRKVTVRMQSIVDLKTPKRVLAYLKDKGLFDKPNAIDHPRCTTKRDEALKGYYYHYKETGKTVFVPDETVIQLTPELLDAMLTSAGLFRHIDIVTQ